MFSKLILIVVTSVAIGIGYYRYLGGSPALFGLGQSCHRRFSNPFRFMATKTPYLDHGLDHEAALGDPFKTYHGGACKPVMAWHLIRHGTRNPGSKVIRTMRTMLPRLREQILEGHMDGKGKLCEEEIVELGKWNTDHLPLESNEKILVKQGENELKAISKRFKQRFPTIYAPKYDNGTFKFKFTKTQRAEASAVNFATGIFHDDQLSQIYYPVPVSADPVLRFYKGCKKWKMEVDKNPDTYLERVKFETSPLFKETIRKLQERLGLVKPPSLEEVEIMYLACSFESAWNPQEPSKWCNVFDEFDLEIMAYRQDIEYYWVDGYGFKLTYEQACATLEDILLKISDKVEHESAPSVIAYFTHSGTLLKVIARLGLFNDSIPLLGSNFEEHRSSRKWRTSHIDPFATNLAFILFRCSGEYKVGLMFKERPIPQPLCGEKYLCSLQEFQDSIEPFINNCDLPLLCKIDEGI